MNVTADLWLSNEESDEFWAEGAKGVIEVEVTDQDEIRIGFVLNGDDTESAGAYVSRATADRLAKFLAAASVTELKVPGAA